MSDSAAIWQLVAAEAPVPDRLFFHAPCFDGAASAAIALSFLVDRWKWSNVELVPINYRSGRQWVTTDIGDRAAVVDFLYHPGAVFWADHHDTTFLTPELRSLNLAQSAQVALYEPTSKSCARLLFDALPRRFHYPTDRFVELAQWADRIDAAEFDSVEDAVFPTRAALQLTVTLSYGSTDEYCISIVRALRESTVDVVAHLPEVQERFHRAQALVSAGLDRVRSTARIVDNGVVIFDAESAGVYINRYAPYALFPTARYSLGTVRGKHGATLTVMRNPWMDFPSAHLGHIAERFGGGGHRRVGAIVIPQEQAANVNTVVAKVLAAIREYDSRAPRD